VLKVSRSDPFSPMRFEDVFKFRKRDLDNPDHRWTCVEPRCARRARAEHLRPGGGSGKYLNWPARQDRGQQFRMLYRSLGFNLRKGARIYFHRSRGGGPYKLMALQYWFFYSYNYQPLAGGGEANKHEGDWERMAVFLERITLRPRVVVFFEHKGTIKKRWKSDGVDKRGGTHPIGYPALGSHATYKGCGRHQDLPAVDNSCVGGIRTYGIKTPLVFLRRKRWACWKGKVGEGGGPAMPLRQQNSDLFPGGGASCPT
jgi:hypothetical protein